VNDTLRYILCLDKYKKPTTKDIVVATVSGIIFEALLLGFWMFDLIPDGLYINMVGTVVWVMALNACDLGIWNLKWRHLVLLFLFAYLWEQVYTAILN